MGNILSETVGAILTALGWDGTGFRAFRVDGDGHLQVDILSIVPGLHAATHENAGADEIDVGGLSGALADDQPFAAHLLAGAKHTADSLADLNLLIDDANVDDDGDPRDPNDHAVNHKDGGGDEIDASELAGALGGANEVLTTNGAACSWQAPAGGGFYDAYVCLRDVQGDGVEGGTFTLGAWRTRVLSEETADTANICSIAGNQITLAAGTYRCLISCPAHRVNYNQAILYNISDTAVEVRGTSEYARATDYGSPRSVIVGHFTLASEKVLEVQHRCSATQANNGFGVDATFGGEVYTIAEFWREA